MTLCFALPIQPTLNRYHRPLGDRIVITAEGRAYRQLVRREVDALRWVKRLPLEPLQGRLSLTLRFHFPDKRRHDLDNLIKNLQDSLAKAQVYVDDGQIDELHIYRALPDPKSPRVVIELCELDAASLSAS